MLDHEAEAGEVAVGAGRLAEVPAIDGQQQLAEPGDRRVFGARIRSAEVVNTLGMSPSLPSRQRGVS